MKSDSNLEQLQKAANYLLVSKILTPSSITTMVFGAIIVALGLLGCVINYSHLSIILIILGLLTIMMAGWALTSPSPVHLLLESLELLSMGILIIITSFMQIGAYAKHASIGGDISIDIGRPITAVIIGFIQVGWSIGIFVKYSRFYNVKIEEPPKDTLKQIKSMVSSINHAKWKKSDDIVEMFWGAYRWKGKLSKDSGIFVAQDIKDIIFAKKENIEIQNLGKVFLGKTRKAFLKIENRSGTGTISPESFARYERWKKASD